MKELHYIAFGIMNNLKIKFTFINYNIEYIDFQQYNMVRYLLVKIGVNIDEC